MNKYNNELLCQSKPEIKKEWVSCWEKLTKLDPMKDYDEMMKLNQRFDKCVEAYYAVDCGTYWKVQSASSVKGRYRTYKVMKES